MPGMYSPPVDVDVIWFYAGNSLPGFFTVTMPLRNHLATLQIYPRYSIYRDDELQIMDLLCYIGREKL